MQYLLLYSYHLAGYFCIILMGKRLGAVIAYQVILIN
jgi:hypothetical protein